MWRLSCRRLDTYATLPAAPYAFPGSPPWPLLEVGLGTGDGGLAVPGAGQTRLGVGLGAVLGEVVGTGVGVAVPGPTATGTGEVLVVGTAVGVAPPRAEVGDGYAVGTALGEAWTGLAVGSAHGSPVGLALGTGDAWLGTGVAVPGPCPLGTGDGVADGDEEWAAATCAELVAATAAPQPLTRASPPTAPTTQTAVTRGLLSCKPMHSS
jgi:hypothetical protein